MMLMEGVPPAMIENVARMAGMPVGPLSLNDEVGARPRLEDPAGDEEGPRRHRPSIPRRRSCSRRWWSSEQRFGRKNGKGFYDYPARRARRRLWPGLAEIAGKALDPDTIDVQELKERFLVTQAVEAARTMEEGVVTDPREADVGSILGFGFAPFTGGTLSLDRRHGRQGVRRARRRARGQIRRRASRRATCCKAMAAKGETFYGRAAAKAAA